MPKVTQPKGKIGGFNIYVEKDSLDMPVPRMARHGILDSNQTLIHYAGKEAFTRDITAVTLSGYQVRFLPLVGSGYHALYTDKGYQGDYWIKSARPERIFPSAPRCHNTGTRRDYRVTMNLRKKSGEPPPEWPGEVVFVGSNSLYYTSSFGSPTDGDPVWVNRTSNLPGGASSIHKAGCDAVNPGSMIYIQQDWGGGSPGYIWRSDDKGLTWELSFTPPTNYTIRDFAVDKVKAGYVYAVCDHSTTDGCRFYTNANYGEPGSDWTYESAGGGGAVNQQGRVDVYDGRVGMWWLDSTPQDQRVRYRESGSWGSSAAAGVSLPVNGACVISYTDGYYYFRYHDSYWRWAKVDPPGGLTNLYSTLGGSGSQSNFWIHPTTAATVRFIKTGAWNGGSGPATAMLVTDDHYATAPTSYNFTETGSTPHIYNINGIHWKGVPHESDNFLVLGSSGYSTLNENSSYTPTPHCILIADGDSDFELVYGKGGANAATSPYTDSIPRTTGGPIKRGILILSYA